jgi:hypothetical protein
MRSLLIIALFPLALFAQGKDTPSAMEPAIKPEVHLNHAFIVPDAETYEAIRNSDFVKQFAVWEERTTHRKDITYTGLYLYGRHTYFEFLKPDERTPVGTSKIAFGVDRTGDLDLLQKRAAAAGIKTEIKTITRAFDGKDVDWFRSLDRKDQDQPSLGLWTLEYVPTFLTEWNPNPKQKPSVRREDVLKRYAEVVKQDLRKKSFDVAMIVVELPEAAIEQSLRECEVLGFQVVHHKIGSECMNDEFTSINFQKGPHSGIVSVLFRLENYDKQLVKNGTYKIGSTVLEIGGVGRHGGALKTAKWTFRPE